ncbi:hypothetical protein OEZ85_013062 [Tetradesmus obliquus]|uniref:Anaphase-promoting complex subunit 4 WD40 domain-containing protein n=1 Tax=Tetradesmus obliquus TaxID=3088 RepID=A0ABY8U4U7_TETOB|nr:hypothetical protein OEZ85_013062 [Tetradesmus obliquus]
MLSGRNAAWLGSRGQHVVSGADDGSLCVWAAGSGQLLTVLHGGDRAVRRVQVNPRQLLLASCGTEPTVRLWSPTADAAAAGHTTAAAAGGRQAADERQEDERRAAMGGLMGMLRQMGERLVWGLLRGGEEDGEEGEAGSENDGLKRLSTYACEALTALPELPT